MSTRIQGKESPLADIFSDQYFFEIPPYQRPYSWELEQAEELLTDLITAAGSSDEDVDAVDPYFLGSVVLIKGEGTPPSQVVDGQQRLTTLTILLSAIRVVAPKLESSIVKRLCEEGDAVMGTPDRFRLRVREKDREFFENHIQKPEGIAAIESLKEPLRDSRERFRENACFFLRRLRELGEAQVARLASFLLKRCFLIVVTTPSEESAFRIFSVLNDRGMDLSAADILKAEVIGKLGPDLAGDYTVKWENCEDLLGRDGFNDVFVHIRMLYARKKQVGILLKEIREHVKPTADPAAFIDDTLIPLGEAYQDLVQASYASTQLADQVNELLGWLHRIDNRDWLPPAMEYYRRHRSNPQAILTFTRELERLAASLFLRRANVNERIRRYAKLIAWIKDEKDLLTTESPLQISDAEIAEVKEHLNGPLYQSVKTRMFVLLRADALLNSGGVTYDHKIITIEHVLPQNPKEESQWRTWWPNEEAREEWVHRLGNLVLLDRIKNASASNHDFKTKKEKYFKGRTGVSPFVLTTQVLNEETWTPTVLEGRQMALVDSLAKLWRLEPQLVNA